MTKFDAQKEQLTTALTRLKEVLAQPKTDITRDSAIQRFEFTLDLSWKATKTFLEEKKGVVCASPKECFREAYRQGIITYEEAWLHFVDMRNETVHTYNEVVAEQIYGQLPSVVKHVDELLNALRR